MKYYKRMLQITKDLTPFFSPESEAQKESKDEAEERAHITIILNASRPCSS